MKNFVIIIVSIVFVFVFCISYAKNNSYNPFEIIEQIKKEQQNCLDTNFQTDYTMAQCNINAKEKYEKEMEVVLKKLKKNLSEQQYDLLMKSQKKWEEYIKEDNLMLENIIEPQKSESGFFYLQSTNIQAESMCNRLKILGSIYFNCLSVHEIMNKINKKFKTDLLP